MPTTPGRIDLPKALARMNRRLTDIERGSTETKPAARFLPVIDTTVPDPEFFPHYLVPDAVDVTPYNVQQGVSSVSIKAGGLLNADYDDVVIRIGFAIAWDVAGGGTLPTFALFYAPGYFEVPGLGHHINLVPDGHNYGIWPVFGGGVDTHGIVGNISLTGQQSPDPGNISFGFDLAITRPVGVRAYQAIFRHFARRLST